MSQEKVDRYKQEKANRKQIMHRQKMMGLVRKCVLTLAGLALIGWLGFSHMIHMSPEKSVWWRKRTTRRCRII